MRAALVAGLVLLALVACSREPRWTLWKIADGDATKVESGLERLVCETLRDRAERDAEAGRQVASQLRRESAAAGLQPGRVTLTPRYRCRPDGEGY